MSTPAIEVTPGKLLEARNTVWLDQDLLSGDGLIEEIAPDVFALWEDGLERVRFGKIVGFANGTEAVLPLLPELVEATSEAALEHPGGCVYLEGMPEEANVEDLWREFFAKQISAIGRLAVGCLRDLLSEAPAFAQDISNLSYVASVIDPSSEIQVLEPSAYDSFDALDYMGLRGTEYNRRKDLAAEIAAVALRKPLYSSADHVHNLMAHTKLLFTSTK